MTRTSGLTRAAVATLLATLLATVALVASPLTRPAGASGYTPVSLSHFDQRLLAHINEARANRGLRRLIVTAGTTDVAHGWSCHLAQYGVLAHNGALALQLERHGSLLWTSYAENVGYQPAESSAWRLFRAYMNSPGHRANILDPSSRFIGVWSKRANGVRYNTLDFVGTGLSAYSDAYGATRRSC